MLTPQQIESFHNDGYLLGPRVLSDAQCDELCRELERVIAEKEKPGVPQPVMLSNLLKGTDRVIWQIVNIFEASDAFRKLVLDPQIITDSAALIDAKQLRVWHDQVQYKPSETGGVNMWHQDSPLWGILQPKDQQITAWVALDDAGEDNGCMSMVPGSHRWGNHMSYLETLKNFQDVPAEFEGHRVDVRLRPVPRGHVHFHHSLTWHGSHSNTSGRPRRAIALHYMNERTTYFAEGRHVMKQFVTVADGQTLSGDRFPLAFDQGKLVNVPAANAHGATQHA